MFLASCLVAFFGLLRISEFACPSQSTFDRTLHLCRDNISFNQANSIMLLRIKGSKTDPFREETTIRLAATYNNLCPVAAVIAYLSLSKNSQGPLFIRSDGRFLTRKAIVCLLHLALPGVTHINSHSFRIGGASAALTAGAPDSLIRTLGRWSSDCYTRYLRIADKDIAAFQSSMSRVAFSTTVWDPDTA